MNWYLDALRQVTNFKGRSRRKAYWMFFLINLLIAMTLVIIDKTMGWTFGAQKAGITSTVYVMASTLPHLALSVRRLHDVGRSGWWSMLGVMFGLSPNILSLAMLVTLYVLLVLKGQEGTNKYGPNPKGDGHNPDPGQALA